MKYFKIMLALGTLALCLASCIGKEKSAVTGQGMRVKVLAVEYATEVPGDTCGCVWKSPNQFP